MTYSRAEPPALGKHSVLKYDLVSCHQLHVGQKPLVKLLSGCKFFFFFFRLSFVTEVFLLVIVAHKMCNVNAEHFLLSLPLFVSRLVATLTKPPLFFLSHRFCMQKSAKLVPGVTLDLIEK